jgi:hypothetical protein
MRALRAATLAVLALLAGGPAAAAAAAGPPDVRDFLGPFLDLGLSVRSQVFRVHSPDGPYGEFASTRLLPALTIGSPMYRIKGGRLGVNLIWNSTALAMGRQTPPDSDFFLGEKGVDVGTSISGYATYLTPTLNFIGKDPASEDETRLGIGVGVGYLRVKGDILLDRPKAGSGGTVENPELRHVDLDQVTPSFSIFGEKRHGPFTFSAGVAGPFVLDDYETDYLDFWISASYSWYRALKRAEPAPR